MTTVAPPKVGFDHILVPMDFTDVSDRALDYARKIASMNSSELILAHIDEPFNPITPAEAVWFAQITEREPDQEKLQTYAAELHTQGYRARSITLVGTIKDEILHAAENEHADLMVLGTHGRSGVMRFLFGSEAEGIYRHSACPIIVIGPEVRPVCESAWFPKGIICACDLDPASAPTAAYAQRLAEEFGAELTILHVDDSEGKASPEETMANFERALVPLLIGEDKPAVLWRTLKQGHNLGSAIADVAIERNAGLIVMGAHPAAHPTMHFLRSNVPHVMAEAPCPVMVVHK